LQAAALHGRNCVSLTDIPSINNVLWEKTEDIPIVEQETIKLVNPFEADLRKLITRVDEINESVADVADKVDRTKKAIEAKAHYEEIVKRLNDLERKSREAGFDAAKINEFRNKVVSAEQAMLSECLGITI
jgi:DNA repair ATPase RecN